MWLVHAAIHGRGRLILRAALAMGVAAVAVALACTGKLDGAALSRALRATAPSAIAFGVTGAIGVVALQSLRWWLIMRPLLGIRYGHALASVWVGGFFNVVLPARAGDAIRVDDLSRRGNVSRAALVGTQLIDFILDKAGWLPAFALLLLSERPPAWMYRACGASALIVVLAVAAAFLARGALTRARGREGWTGNLANGLTASSGRRLAFVGLTAAASPWLWESFIVWGFVRIDGLHLGALQAFIVLTAFNVAGIVPMPGNVGVHEAASSAVLVSFGVPIEHALAVAVSYHATQLVTLVVGGGVFFLSRRFVARRLPSPPPSTPLPSNDG